MNFGLSVIWEFAIDFFECILFFIYVNSHLLRNKFHTVFIILFFLCHTIILTIFNISSCPSILAVTFPFMTNLLFTLIFYKNPIGERLFRGCFFSVLTLIADRITMWIPALFNNMNYNDFFFHGNLRKEATLIYLLLVGILVFIFTHVTSRKMYIPIWYRILLLLTCLIGLVIAHSIQSLSFYVYNSEPSSYIGDWIVYINIAFISLFLLLLFYIYRLGISQANYQRLLMEQKQVEMEIQQREAFLEASQSIRETKHDLKNHILILQSLLQSESYDEMASYLSQLSDDIPETSHLIYSGNRSLDSVLTIKLLKAKNAGITITSSLYLPDKLALGDLELCSIFGNLLDNAVEACLRLPDSSDRWLRITIREQNTMLLFLVENSSNGNYQYDKNHHLISSKAEQNHGLGLHRVHTLVKRVDGILDIKPEADMFSISILLPLKQEDHKNYAD